MEPLEHSARLILPNPSLQPEDVVRLQLDALRAFPSDNSAVRQCYVLASPENRQATGPLQKFTAMIERPDYAPLLQQEQLVVGGPVLRGEHATILVTVVNARRQANVYRFFLSRQANGDNAGCWMTDAVLHDEPDLPSPPPEQTSGGTERT